MGTSMVTGEGVAMVFTYLVVTVSVTVSVEVTGTVVTLPPVVIVLYTTKMKLACTPDCWKETRTFWVNFCHYNH